MTTRLVRAALLVALGALTPVVGCTIEDRTDAGDDLDGGLLRGFGEGCTRTEDCASGLCLLVGPRSICTDLCTDDADCPTAPNWGCVEPEALGARVCGCNGSSDTEVCGNGRDDDCNGEVDECRICDGVPVAEDDPAHCGACDNACRFDQECSGGVCRCPAGLTDCAGACVDTETSTAHCGACDDACEPGAACVGGACACGSPELSLCAGVGCVDLSSSFVHCGVCGNRCPSGGVCRDGRCECTSSTATDCDGVCVETGSDVNHCGGCGVACLPGEVCSRGTCSCDPSTPDRCSTGCVDLRYDSANCGSCGFSCATGAYCVAGACRCPRGGRECDGVCYALGDEGNCGGCGLTCPAGQYCEDSTDACACTAFGGAPCPDGSCHDWLNDPLHCGGCGVACRPTEVCASGSCVCPTGTYCPGDGCVSIDRDPANCGGCGVACDPTQTCSFGTCRCPTGTTLCPGFGCVSTASDPMNCGGCGNACTTSGQSCSSGRCTCPSSAPTVCGGACVDTYDDSSNCGGCGNVCPSGTSCLFGSCRCPGASTGELYCPSVAACVDTRTSNEHCGWCDNACPAEATCMGGICACPTPGYSACGTSCVDRLTDEANCGTCGRVCTGSLVCLAGSCTCDPPVPGTEVRVTNAADISENVAVAWNGSEAMVVWQDARLGTWQVFVQRISAAGALLGAAVRVSAATSLNQAQDPDVVWTGTEWGVVWAESVPGVGENLFLARYRADGVRISGPVLIGASFAGGAQNELLHTAALGYVIVRRTRDGIIFQSFGPLGTSPALPITVMPGWTTDLSTAVSPTGEVGVLSGMGFQSINADGSITSGALTLIGVDGPTSLAHDGASWIAAWMGFDGSNSTIVLARGTAFGSRTVVTSRLAGGATQPRFRRPSLIVSGPLAVVTWQGTVSGADSVWRIEGRRYSLASAGPAVALDTALSTYMPTTSVYDQPHGMVAVPGGVILAWADSRWGATEVYEQLVSMTPCAP